MNSLTRLESLAQELTAAVENLTNYCRRADVDPCCVPAEAPKEEHVARRSILASVTQVQILLDGPVDFLQRLATQTQLLACLRWLGEFQVLACVPFSGSVPIQDLADLCGVSEGQISCVIRMTAMAGFLEEPQPHQVAHTLLSAHFVHRPSLLDAIMFLAISGAPAALQMAEVTQRDTAATVTREISCRQVIDPGATLAAAPWEQRPKMQRQWATYLHYLAQEDEESVIDVLTRLDWPNLGRACVVEVDAPSCVMAGALAMLYPALHFIVQISEHSHDAASGAELPALVRARIAVQQRVSGTPPTVTNAAAYIFRLPQHCQFPSVPSPSLALRITGELRAHFGVLRANPRSILILTARPIPEPGAINPRLETLARMSDLSRLQLTNERTMPIEKLIQLLQSVGDDTGWLMVAKQLLSSDKTTVALVAKYQPYQQGLSAF